MNLRERFSDLETRQTIYEIFLLLGLFLVAVYLRFDRLKIFSLPREFEIYLLRSLHSISPFAGFSGSSLPTKLLANLFFFFGSVSEYRMLIASLGVLTVLIFYIALRKLTHSRGLSFLSALVLATHKIAINKSRVFENVWTDMFVPALSLLLYAYWSERDEAHDIYFVLASAFIALGVLNHAVVIYFAAAFFSFLLYNYYKDRLNLKLLAYCLTIFTVIASPYLYTLPSQGSINTIKNKYEVYESAYTGLKPINIIEPLPALENLYEGLLSFPFPQPFSFSIALTFLALLLALPALCLLYEGRHDLLILTYGTLVFLFISFSPFYTVPESLPFYLLFLAALAVVAAPTVSFKTLCGYLLLILLLFNALNLPMHNNRISGLSEAVSRIDNKTNKPVLIEETSLMVLNATDVSHNLSFISFRCRRRQVSPPSVFADNSHVDWIIGHRRCSKLDSLPESFNFSQKDRITNLLVWKRD